MLCRSRWIEFLLLLVICSQLIACEAEQVAAKDDDPARIETIAGSEYNHVILTIGAAERLQITTDIVRAETLDGKTRLVVPYATVLYGLNGETWLYTTPKPLTYVRAPIVIDYIENNTAVLEDGPPTGTEVVTVGASELYGVDTGVGK